MGCFCWVCFLVLSALCQTHAYCLQPHRAGCPSTALRHRLQPVTFIEAQPGLNTFAPGRDAVELEALQRRPSSIRMQLEGSSGGSSGSSGSSGRAGAPFVNGIILTQLAASQLIIGIVAALVSRGGTIDLITHSIHLDQLSSVVVGVLASMPLLALNRAVEESESPLFAELNMATNLFVYSIFGLRRQPVVALLVSLALGLLVGTVEETVFRGQVFPALSGWLSSVDVDLTTSESLFLAALLSSTLFAAGHLNFRGGLEQLLSEETKILFGVQVLGGLIYCALFLLTGDLTAPVVAHAMFDFAVLYGTHLRSSGQFAYAMSASKTEGSEVDPLRLVFFLMDTDKDGVVSRRELRIGLYSFGVVLPREWSGGLFSYADTDESGQLDFDEFTEFVKDGAGEASNAIKRSVLGVRL